MSVYVSGTVLGDGKKIVKKGVKENPCLPGAWFLVRGYQTISKINK